ncbi:hypothetical protein LNO88_06960 [Klebsiella pneumoniae subsp. pneumoniae]|nr:hypothetical protein [Klebsiella pneumoniae subsp. pneumoniae]
MFFLSLAAVPSASFTGFTSMISSRVQGTPSSRSLNLASFPSMNLFVMHYSFPVTPAFCELREFVSDNTTPMGIQTTYLPIDENNAFTEEELLEFGSLYKLLAQKWDLNYLKLMKRLALANPLPLKLHCSSSPFMMSF